VESFQEVRNLSKVRHGILRRLSKVKLTIGGRLVGVRFALQKTLLISATTGGVTYEVRIIVLVVPLLRDRSEASGEILEDPERVSSSTGRSRLLLPTELQIPLYANLDAVGY